MLANDGKQEVVCEVWRVQDERWWLEEGASHLKRDSFSQHLNVKKLFRINSEMAESIPISWPRKYSSV